MNKSDFLRLLEDVVQEISDFKEISQNAFLTLYTLFGTKIIGTLELIDKCTITKYQTRESGRIFYRVIDPDPDLRAILTSKKTNSRKRQKPQQLGDGEDEYIILENSDYCPCYVHAKEVLSNKCLM